MSMRISFVKTITKIPSSLQLVAGRVGCKLFCVIFVSITSLFYSKDCRYYTEKARGAALQVENVVVWC